MTIGLIFKGQVTCSPPLLLGQVTLFALATLAHKGVILVRFGGNGHLPPSRAVIPPGR